MTSRKRLFLIDGIGAVISALALGVFMPMFQSHFGVPIPTLYLLATIPIFFAIYDFVCIQISAEGRALIIIAYCNFGYCVLSIFLLANHFHSLTNLAFVYFTLELVIVAGLGITELKISNRN